MKLHLEYVDEDTGDDVEAEVPARYEVCRECQGSGTELYGSLKGCAISPEEFADDPDFAESYFGGSYDVPCSCCKGQRVELRPDIDSCSPEELAHVKNWNQSEIANARSLRADLETFWAESGTPISERY